MLVKVNIDIDLIFRFFLLEGFGLKYKWLVQGIEEFICNGVFWQGVKLLLYCIFVDKFGVIVGMVSWVYGELECMGLVEVWVGDGMFVCNCG